MLLASCCCVLHKRRVTQSFPDAPLCTLTKHLCPWPCRGLAGKISQSRDKKLGSGRSESGQTPGLAMSAAASGPQRYGYKHVIMLTPYRLFYLAACSVASTAVSMISEETYLLACLLQTFLIYWLLGVYGCSSVPTACACCTAGMMGQIHKLLPQPLLQPVLDSYSSSLVHLVSVRFSRARPATSDQVRRSDMQTLNASTLTAERTTCLVHACAAVSNIINNYTYNTYSNFVLPSGQTNITNNAASSAANGNSGTLQPADLQPRCGDILYAYAPLPADELDKRRSSHCSSPERAHRAEESGDRASAQSRVERTFCTLEHMFNARAVPDTSTSRYRLL